MKHFILFIIFFIFDNSVLADVKIDPKNHMQNKEPGRCAWAAAETLGRTHGWKSLKGLVERNNRVAYREDLIKELDANNIKYQVLYPEYGEYFYYLIHQIPKTTKTEIYTITRSKKESNYLLKTLKIAGSWWVEKHHHWDTSFLQKSLKENLGAIVSLDEEDEENELTRHMVVLTHMDN